MTNNIICFAHIYLFIYCVMTHSFFLLFQNGLISAIPFICNFVSIIAFGNIVDYVRSRGLCSTEVVRKIATAAGRLCCKKG